MRKDTTSLHAMLRRFERLAGRRLIDTTRRIRRAVGLGELEDALGHEKETHDIGKGSRRVNGYPEESTTERVQQALDRLP